MTHQPKAYFILGPQGSGKSTQAQMLASELGLPIYIQGDVIRNFLNSGTPEALEIKSKVDHGELIALKIVSDLFREFVGRYDCSKGVIIDGLPRTLEQTNLIQEVAHEHAWQVVAIYIDICDETAMRRLLKREVVIEGQSTTRADDTPQIILKRLETFKKETRPVLEWFKDHYSLITIDGEPDVTIVSQSVRDAVRL